MGAQKMLKVLVALVLVAGMFPTAASAREMQAGTFENISSSEQTSEQADDLVLEEQTTLDILQAGLAPTGDGALEGLGTQASGLTAVQAEKIRELTLYAFESLETEVDISELRIVYSESTWSAIGDVIADVVNSRPDLFYANESCSCSYYPGGTFASLKLYYSYDENDIGKMKTAYESAMQNLISWVPADASKVQQAKAVHDWLVRNCNYNDDAAASSGPSSFGTHDPWNSYGALVRHKPVCEGYTLAFIDAMNRLDIPCSYVSNWIGNEGHAWNRAKVDGSWFNLDVTWDDNFTDPSFNALPDTTYFMKSDRWFTTNEDEDEFHMAWTPKGVAGTDTRYDNFTNDDWPTYSGPAESAEGPVTAFALSAGKLALQTGATATIRIQGIKPTTLDSPATRAKATWTSSRPKIAAVDSRGGIIAGQVAGTTTITCAIGAIKRTCTVTVSKPPLAKGQVVAKDGATYKVTNSGKQVVTLLQAPNANKVKVLKTVSLMGNTYTVSGIAASAFSRSKATVVNVKSPTLTKASVKGCFKGSKVKTVKVPAAKKAAYKKIFTKANAGLKVKVA